MKVEYTIHITDYLSEEELALPEEELERAGAVKYFEIVRAIREVTDRERTYIVGGSVVEELEEGEREAFEKHKQALKERL
jgi:hypothetical protein